MATTWTANREVQAQEVLLARWDLDDDCLQRGDLTDDTIQVSTGNDTSRTERTAI